MSFFDKFFKKKDTINASNLNQESPKESSSAITALCTSLSKEYEESMALREKIGIASSDETSEQVKIFLEYNDFERAKSYTDISNFVKVISNQNQKLRNLLSVKKTEKSTINEYLTLLSEDTDNTIDYRIDNRLPQTQIHDDDGDNEDHDMDLDLDHCEVYDCGKWKFDRRADTSADSDSNIMSEIAISLDSCKILALSSSENSCNFTYVTAEDFDRHIDSTKTTGDNLLDTDPSTDPNFTNSPTDSTPNMELSTLTLSSSYVATCTLGNIQLNLNGSSLSIPPTDI